MMAPNTIEEYVSNSVVGLSDLLHPKTFVAPVETLSVVDTWQVKSLSAAATEASGRKTMIRHRGSRLWVALSR